MKRLLLVLFGLAIAGASFGQEDGADFPFGLIIAEQARASFTLQGAGARAAGMGGAFTAVADDATAASFNPAGLAQLLVPEASVVWNRTDLTDNYRGFVSFGEQPALYLNDTTVEYTKDDLNFLSLTFPFRALQRRWAVQFSTHKVVDFNYEGILDFWGVDGQGNPSARILQSSLQNGDISTSSASVAVELTQRTLLGVTFNRWEGEWGFTSINARAELQTPGDFEFLSYEQTSTMQGTNLDIGLLLRYPHFNVGVRYRTPFDADYSIRARVQPEALQSLDRLDTTLDWPSTWNVGIAAKPFDRWLIAVDWGRTDWSGLEFNLDRDQYINFFDLLPPEHTFTSVTEDWRIGTEFLFFAGKWVIPIRAGWFREPQPSRDLWTAQQIEGEGYSFGFGVKRGTIALDFAVKYRTSETAVSRFFLPNDLVSSDLAPNSVGMLDREEISAFASLIIQFPKGTKLRNVLDRIFVGPPEKKPAVEEPTADHE